MDAIALVGMEEGASGRQPAIGFPQWRLALEQIRIRCWRSAAVSAAAGADCRGARAGRRRRCHEAAVSWSSRRSSRTMP
ncbi:hypothetical protein ACU4GD_31000 [Cupriavidus basilensis]